ncbi:hypothetical protein ACQFX6_19600 [Streptomyces sp. DSM 41987]|nr:hypothetical protein [Streptomyces fildesensis]
MRDREDVGPAGGARARMVRSRVGEAWDLALSAEEFAAIKGVVVGEVCKEVRGIVLSRRQVGLDEWIDALAQALADAAASNARAREAIERFLSGPAGAAGPAGPG